MRLDIEPEQEICLVFGKKEIRRSRFHQQLPNDHFSIEQTKPAIDDSSISEILLITYGTNGSRPGARLGFEARIKGFTEEGRLILHKLNDPAPCDLRNWPRIKKNLLPDIRAKCQKKESQVVDISNNGTHLMLYEADAAPKIGAKVKLKFIFNENEMEIVGIILRKWKDEFQRLHMAIYFDEKNNIGKFIY